MGIDKPQNIGRRDILRRVGLMGAADVLESIVARLIPSDALGPGASEARAAHYIDRALGGALASWRPAGLAAMLMLVGLTAEAQTPDSVGHPQDVHDMQGMTMSAPPTNWQFMEDGSLLAIYNRQGGPRGGREATFPNWWMGMASRSVGGGRLLLIGMMSLDPATVAPNGYRELFQVGEAFDGRPLIDRQHPHDFLMQASAAWRMPLGQRTQVTVAGGPAGEPALGPPVFMHRASAAAIPFAPLSHHTFDSTHISFGVATLGVERGPWTFETSLFNGREPDEHRWNVDFGRMDSVSGRVWFRPTSSWALQVSSGHLVEAEELAPGDTVRSTASGSWRRGSGAGWSAATLGYGMNQERGHTRRAVFGEGSRASGATTMSTRLELTQLETSLLLGAVGGDDGTAVVGALTMGAQREIGRWRGFVGAVGANLTVFAVPAALRATHGSRPASFQLFCRLRPPTGGMGQMWDMRMGQ